MTIAGIDLFGDLTEVGIALLAVAFIGSYFVKRAIGIGAMSPAVLFGTMLRGPHHAILLGVATNAVSHLQFLPQGLRDGDWQVARQVMVGNIAGSILGIWIFGQAATGFIDRALLVEGAVMLPAIVFGGIVGTWFHRKLAVRGFFLFFQLVILFGAVSPLWRGVKGLFYTRDPKRGTQIQHEGEDPD